MKKIIQITIAFLCFNIACFADRGMEDLTYENKQETRYVFK